MPRIPTFDEPTVRVRPAGPTYLQVNPTPEAFGSQVGVGLQQGVNAAAGTFAEIAHEEKVKADTTAVLNADTQLNDYITEKLYHPKTGYATLQGQAAAAARGTTFDDISQTRAKIRDSLTNEDQKRAFEMRTAPTLDSTSKQMAVHAAQQVKVAEDASYKLNQTSNLARLQNGFTLPAVRDEAMNAIESAAAAQAASQGLDPTARSQYVEQAKAEAAKTIVSGFVAARDAKGATEAMAQYGTMLGPYAHELQNSINVLNTAVKGQAIAMDIANDRSVWLPGGELNLAKARQIIDAKNLDPWTANMVHDQLQQRAAEKVQAHNALNDYQAAKALAAFTMQGPDGRPQNSVAAVQLLAPDAWAYLSNPANGLKALEMRRTLEAWDQAEKTRERQEGMIASAPQAARAIELESWLYENKAQLGKFPAQWFSSQWMRTGDSGEPLLSRADYQRLGNIFAQFHAPNAPAQVVAPREAVIDEVKESVWPHLKAGGKWSSDQIAVVNELERRVERFMQTERDPAKVRDFIRGELVKVNVPGKIWGTNETTKIQAETSGKKVLGPATPAAPAPKPSAEPAPPGVPTGWIKYRRKSNPNEQRWNAPGISNPDWEPAP